MNNSYLCGILLSPYYPMAKQIKTIKCPQCGSVLKTEIKPDYFRCNSCGTEYFLDNDDVNINIRHQYRQEQVQEPSSTNRVKGVLIFGVCAFFVSAIVLVFILGAIGRSNSYHTFPFGQTENERYLLSTLLPGEENPIAFTIERNSRSDSVFAAFTDITTGSVLKKQALPQRKNESSSVYSRYFHSDSTLWLICGGNRIFSVDRRQYTLTDMTAEICARKPALGAGILSASFVDESFGEGFKLHTGLGKTLYFFPAPDVLYTEQAAQYAATAPPLPSAKAMTFYLFRNRETSYSSNVAELMRIDYLFNGGGPENKMTKLNGSVDKDNHRIVSYNAITEERIYFSPEVLYHDAECILISYRPTVAEDAGMNIELLDTEGNVVWTAPFTNALEIRSSIRTAAGFMLQVGDDGFCLIGGDGKNVQTYTMPEN